MPLLSWVLGVLGAGGAVVVTTQLNRRAHERVIRALQHVNHTRIGEVEASFSPGGPLAHTKRVVIVIEGGLLLCRGKGPFLQLSRKPDPPPAVDGVVRVSSLNYLVREGADLVFEVEGPVPTTWRLHDLTDRHRWAIIKGVGDLQVPGG